MSGETDELESIKQAIKEVRREGLKAASVYAVVDAAVALMAANLFFTLFAIQQVPDSVAVGVPNFLARGINWVSLKATGSLAVEYGQPVDVNGSVVVALGFALLVFLVDFGVRSRKYSVERFEEVNPKVEEALRTARDTSRDGTENTMARKLYNDVVQGLKSTTSTKLVDDSRIFTTVVVIILLSVATFYISMVGFTLNSEDSPLNDFIQPDPTGAQQQQAKGKSAQAVEEYEGLKSPDDVLGDEESVTSGSDDVNVGLKSSGGEGGGGGGTRGDAYDNSGYSGNGVSSQEAGFENEEEVENSEIVKEYNLKIRDNQEDGENE